MLPQLLAILLILSAFVGGAWCGWYFGRKYQEIKDKPERVVYKEVKVGRPLEEVDSPDDEELAEIEADKKRARHG